tara:strand:+ start:43 stop:261 length:219 start_codon:yes stop_codon:yes gene_type:complete
MFHKFLITIIFGINFLYPCAVCYGNPEDPMAKGMSMGVLTLLGFVVFILIVIGTSILMLSYKTKSINNSKEL